MGVPIVSQTITYTNPRTGETSKYRTTNYEIANQVEDIQKSGFIIDKIESASKSHKRQYTAIYNRSSGGGSSNNKKEEKKVVEKTPEEIEETIPNIPDAKSLPSKSKLKTIEEKVGNVDRYKIDPTIKNNPASTTATPETLIFRDTGSGIEVKPSYQQKVKQYNENTENLRAEMNRIKKYFIGYENNDPTKPIYVTKTRSKADFGYSPSDTDYLQASIDIQNQAKPINQNINTIDNTIKDVKGYSVYLQDQLKNIEDAPQDAMFEVDFDSDGVVDDVFTKNRFNDYLNKELKKNKEFVNDLRVERKKQVGYLSDVKNTEKILQGYKQLGYELDISDSGYSFFEPKDTDVMEWKYGKTGSDILITTSAFLDSPLGVRSAADILIGNDPSERLAGRSLDMSETLETKGVGVDYLMGDIGVSPAFVEGVVIPVATMGLGYGVGSIVGKSSGTIAKINAGASKFFNPAGKQVFTKTLSGVKTISKPFTTAAIYGVSEGPRLYSTYKNNPKDIGGVFAESVFTFGLQVGAFKQGMKSGIKSSKSVVKNIPQDQLIQSKNVEIVQKPSKFFKNRTNFTGSMDATISNSKEPVKVTFEGVSIKTKTGTVSRGSMLVKQDVKEIGTIHSRSTPYNFLTEGEIVKFIRSPKGIKLFEVNSTGLSATRDYKNMTLSKAKSLVLSKGDKVKVKGFLDFGRFESGLVDYNTKVISIQPAEKSSFLTAGKFVAKSGIKGNIVFKGNIYNIESGDAIKQYISKARRGLFSSESAISSIGRQPVEKNVFSVNFLQDVGANISDFTTVNSIPIVNSSSISSKTVVLPLLKSNISSNIVKPKKYTVYANKQNIKTYQRKLNANIFKYNLINDIKQDSLLTNLNVNSVVNETKKDRRSITKNIFDISPIQQQKQELALSQDVRSKYSLKQSQASIQKYDLLTAEVGVGDFGFDFNIIDPIPVTPLPFGRVGGTYTAILDRPKPKRVSFFGKKTKIQKLDKGLLPSPLNVLRSQILYGKATKPKLTKEIWSKGEKSLFMDVPTKEQLKNKRRKKYEFI